MRDDKEKPKHCEQKYVHILRVQRKKFMQDVLNGRENCKRVTHNGRNEVCY